jgi:hypothetical protein
VLLLKTHGENLKTVILTGVHALESKPQLNPGDIILLSQTIATLPVGHQPIQYAARFGRFVDDTENISDRLWGRHWKYLLVLADRWRLRVPFRMRDVQVTDAGYEQGGPYAYVASADEERIRRLGLLEGSAGSGSRPDTPSDFGSQSDVTELFHRLWSLAVGQEGYVKDDWRKLGAALRRGNQLT